MEVKYEEEDLWLILLFSLPTSYLNFRDTILYSRETLTLDEVYEALFFKEKMKHLVVRSKSQVEGLVVQGRTHKKNFGGVERDKTCNYYKKNRHIIFNVISCRIRIREILNKKGSNQKNLVKLVLQKITIVMETAYLLLMLTPNLLMIGFLIQVVRFICVLIEAGFQHVSTGAVMMGNNASCKIVGIGTV